MVALWHMDDGISVKRTYVILWASEVREHKLCWFFFYLEKTIYFYSVELQNKLEDILHQFMFLLLTFQEEC